MSIDPHRAPPSSGCVRSDVVYLNRMQVVFSRCVPESPHGLSGLCDRTRRPRGHREGRLETKAWDFLVFQIPVSNLALLNSLSTSSCGLEPVVQPLRAWAKLAAYFNN